ncbi:hypothetical protein ACFE04_026523 [Oxalis oulophora]
MGTSEKTFVPIVKLLLFQLFILSKHVHGIEGVELPPFNVSPEVLMQHIQNDYNSNLEKGWRKIDLDGVKLELPAIYAFGDSYIDSGNAMILNKMKLGLPYGVDFNSSFPNFGRVTNGRTILDFLAQIVGLPFPTTYLAMSDAEKNSTRTGINFAVSGAGILKTTLPPFGKILNMDEQIDSFERVLKSLKYQFDSAESFTDYMSSSLFFINIGSNDFGFTYATKYAHRNMSHKAFAEVLGKPFLKQLERLYNLGARKFLINNAIPMGDTPTAVKMFNGNINKNLNEAVLNFNLYVTVESQQLQSKLPGSKFTIGDIYSVIHDAVRYASYGFLETLEPCCFVCNVTSVCKDLNEHVFFDHTHVTEAVHYLILRRFFTEQFRGDPIPIIELIDPSIDSDHLYE